MLAFALALVPTSSALATGSDLFEKPFRWKDARGIVDVGNGRTMLSLADLDADGLPDLVAGGSRDAKLLWYRNAGTPRAPRFVDPAWAQVSRQDSRAWVIEDVPLVVDLDGDGIPDLIACVSGDILFSRGLGQRTFAPSQKLLDLGRLSVGVASTSSISVADWNGDGKPDLVVVDRGDELRVLPGLGWKDDGLAFGFATKMELVENEPVPTAGPSPLVVDWDGDGVLDLLVGSAEGAVVFYKGYVEQGAHLVQPGEVLLQPCYVDQPATLAKNEKTGALEPQLTRSHRCPRLAVCDWNGDGRLDLLVGDLFAAREPDPQLTTEQATRRDDLLAQMNEIEKQFGVARKEIEERVDQDLSKLGLDSKLAAAREVREDLLRLRKNEDARYSKLTSRLDELSKEFEPLTAKVQQHGYVWVYLRKSAGLASAK